MKFTDLFKNNSKAWGAAVGAPVGAAVAEFVIWGLKKSATFSDVPEGAVTAIVIALCAYVSTWAFPRNQETGSDAGRSAHPRDHRQEPVAHHRDHALHAGGSEARRVGSPPAPNRILAEPVRAVRAGCAATAGQVDGAALASLAASLADGPARGTPVPLVLLV